MKVQLASDLHLEFLAHCCPGETLIRPAHQADVLVLAGDVAHASNAVPLFKDWPVPVLYVLGNHEFYGGCIETVREELAGAIAGTSVRVLERDAVDFGGVRFLGCTLWTEYRLRSNRTQRQLMEHAALCLNDHRLVQIRPGELFTPEHALNDHEASRAWLAQQLSEPYEGKTVVVTHHAPHPLSIHPRYGGDPTNAAFASELPQLLQMADVWLHGHVHDSFDYSVEGCRVVANPRGYALKLGAARDIGALKFENSAFEQDLVIDLNDI